MNKAAFYLETYIFKEVMIDVNNQTSKDINVSFLPSGVFLTEEASYKLTFIFLAYNNDKEKPFVKISCTATFKFEEVITTDDIPSYFYRNSIAILFPYIRAFVSTVTLQANIPPVVLPTMNLSSLETPLKENTTQL